MTPFACITQQQARTCHPCAHFYPESAPITLDFNQPVKEKNKVVLPHLSSMLLLVDHQALLLRPQYLAVLYPEPLRLPSIAPMPKDKLARPSRRACLTLRPRQETNYCLPGCRGVARNAVQQKVWRQQHHHAARLQLCSICHIQGVQLAFCSVLSQ